MPLPLRTIFAWLERHREKLIDAALLVFALNCSGLYSAPPPPWSAQLAMLLIFAALASPSAHLLPGLWQRYLRFLPGYAVAALAGVALFSFWFNLPRAQLWFAPLWLVSTAVVRLPFVLLAQRTISALQGRRLDLLGLDLALLLAAAWAVPLWCGLPSAGLLATVLLGLVWLGVHGATCWHDPARFPKLGVWLAPALALAWGVTWCVSSGAGVAMPALVFGLWFGLALLAGRLAARRWASTGADGVAEVTRWLGLLAVAFFLFHPFARSGLHGSGDALYYATFLADALEQFRHGAFPVFAGQTEFQFNGSVIPIRVAPGFQHVGGLIDLLMGRTLGPMAVQNLAIVLAGLGGLFSAYACLRRIGAQAAHAWPLALLYLTCPGAVGLAFNSDLYMSWLTFPLVPPVLLLGLLSFRQSGWKLYAALGFVVGLTWWMHPPVALWLTMISSALQVARLATSRPNSAVLAPELAAGAGVFLLVACYPLGSTVLYPADPALGSSISLVKQTGAPAAHPAPHVVQQLLETFPAAWRPMSAQGRLLTDYQLGYGLLLVGLLAAVAAWRTRRIELRVMAGLAGLLLLLLIPVPWLNLQLWRLVPATVINITNVWAMQRLYLLLAALIAFLAASAWTTAAPARFVRIALLAGCLWSLGEAVKFVRGSWAATTAASYTTTSLLPENVTLTRYSYGLFAAKPAYFTHGVTDPVLENRFLAADLHTVVGGNAAAAARLVRTGSSTEQVFFAGADRLNLPHPVTLAPGRRYLAEVLTTVTPFPSATLVLHGATLHRVYGLPEYGEARSFGLGGDTTPFFPLRTSGSREENVSVQIIPGDRAALSALDGRVRLRLAEYDPAALPVQISSWVPYTARVQTDDPVWLETPRMYQTGYAATFDGHPAEVKRSVEGLASVRVPAGVSVVELRYLAPAGLRGAFWLSFVSICAGLIVALFAGWRELTAGPAARATPAAPSR